MPMRPLHPDEERLIEQMKKAGVEAIARTPDDLATSDVQDANVMVLTMNAGAIDEAADAARTANEIVAHKPKIRFLFAVNGCGDDPREVDEIPEARVSLRALFQELSPAAFHRFELDHQALMLVAMGLGVRLDGGQLKVPPWMVRDPAA